MKEVNSQNYLKGRLRQNLIFLIAVAIIVLLMINTYISDDWGLRRDTSITNIVDWQVSSLNSLQAEVLWQKSIPCLSEGFTSPYGSLTISLQHVVIHQTCSSFDGSRLIAFDVVAGSVAWSSSINELMHAAWQISHTDAGYFALVNDSSVIRLDYEGAILWRSEDFDSRTVRSFELVNNQIYAPYRASYGLGFHILSQETGQTIERLEYPNVISIYPDFVIRYSDQALEIAETSDSPTLWTTSTFSVEREDIFTDLVGDILLVYFDLRHIKAYRLDTGEEIWSIDGDFVSYPVLTENRLITYTDENILEVYDVETGTLNGQTQLSRNGTSDFRPQVFIAAEGNIIALVYYNSDELVVLRLNDG